MENIATDESNMTAADFERELIRSIAAAGAVRRRTGGQGNWTVQKRIFQLDGPKRIFDRERVGASRLQGLSLTQDRA